MTVTLARLPTAACIGSVGRNIAPAAAQDDHPKGARHRAVRAGRLNHLLARAVGAELSERLGKQFIVSKNKTGAAGIVGRAGWRSRWSIGDTLDYRAGIAHWLVDLVLSKSAYDAKAFVDIRCSASSPTAFRDLSAPAGQRPAIDRAAIETGDTTTPRRRCRWSAASAWSCPSSPRHRPVARAIPRRGPGDHRCRSAVTKGESWPTVTSACAVYQVRQLRRLGMSGRQEAV